jgi:hypothetical protein
MVRLITTSRLQIQTTSVSSTYGCDGSRQTPIEIKRMAKHCLSPWRLRRPRRTLVPQCVQWVHRIPVAANVPAPILFWFALQAIRFTANR